MSGTNTQLAAPAVRKSRELDLCAVPSDNRALPAEGSCPTALAAGLASAPLKNAGFGQDPFRFYTLAWRSR